MFHLGRRLAALSAAAALGLSLSPGVAAAETPSFSDLVMARATAIAASNPDAGSLEKTADDDPRGLPAGAREEALGLADDVDPSGGLSPLVDEVVNGANGALLNPGPPAPTRTIVDCPEERTHERPVIVVHGTWSNGPNIAQSLGRGLADRGFCVFVPTVGAYADDPRRGGLDSILVNSGPQLASVVDEVRSRTGSEQVDLVGFSQGASIAGYVAKTLRPGAVNSLVSVGGFWGDDPSYLAPDDVSPDLARAALWAGNMRGLAELIPGGPLQAVWYAPDNSPYAPGVRYTMIFSEFDTTAPPGPSFRPGPNVERVLLQDGCPHNQADHFQTGRSERSIALVARALGHQGTVPC